MPSFLHRLYRSVPLVLLCLLAPVSAIGKGKDKEARRPRAKTSKRLKALPGGKLLRSDAAAAFQRMRTSAQAEGVRLWVISAYRSRQQQRFLYERYRRGEGPKAARPGRSNHQRGLALDLFVGDDSSDIYAWLAANACRHGFRQTVRSEPWHWEYRPRTTRKPAKGRDCLGRPLPPEEPPSQEADPTRS